MRYKYGWKAQRPDPRDHKLGLVPNLHLPTHVDLRGVPAQPPIYDQGQLGSCTANAIAGAIEYDRRREGIVDFVPSRLFIYWQERNMEGTVDQDSGAAIRDGIKAVNTFGAPPEYRWPYDITKFTATPSPAAVASAILHKSVSYSAVDSSSMAAIKNSLAASIPVIFGFTCFTSFESDAVAASGVLNMPAPDEEDIGGHAVVIVGYDDASQRVIIRNSFGTGWGQKGFFTMPYEYVTNPDLASDFWVISVTK